MSCYRISVEADENHKFTYTGHIGYCPASHYTNIYIYELIKSVYLCDFLVNRDSIFFFVLMRRNFFFSNIIYTLFTIIYVVQYLSLIN